MQSPSQWTGGHWAELADGAGFDVSLPVGAVSMGRRETELRAMAVFPPLPLHLYKYALLLTITYDNIPSPNPHQFPILTPKITSTKMVCVAVAGASSGVGKVIADAVAAGNKHEYIILSRNPSAELKTVQVDYSDIDALAATLDKYQVDTVISGLSLTTDEAGQNQANLIEAAKRASSTKRFIPSEYGSKWNPE